MDWPDSVQKRTGLCDAAQKQKYVRSMNLKVVYFRMECPTERDVPDAQRYYVDRKNSYCLLAMAICDSKRRFTWVDIGMAPSTHDSTAWSATPLGMRVEAGDLPYPFFLNGDSAFTVSPSMITPSNNDPALDDFDFYQSSNRMAIECAFGHPDPQMGSALAQVAPEV